MAKLEQEFSPADVPANERSFDPIPAGTYNLQVIESRIEDTKNGSGQMLVLTLEVIDGEYAGRKIWDRLNIRNQNPDAQRIAQRALADLCISLGIVELSDSEELHFKPFTARVRIESDKSGQYDPQNRVRYNGAPPAQKAPAQKAPPAKPVATAPTKAAKPWARKAADDPPY
jgi:hypothetical protein